MWNKKEEQTMSEKIEFSLSFRGNASDYHEIDFYDVGQALIGFQRSLALTTHLVLNNQIITQAPSLKGAKINAIPPKEGSWEFTTIISVFVAGGYVALTAGKETVLGNLVNSAYDYVVKQSLGFHVDFDKTLGQQFEEFHYSENSKDVRPESRFDSLIEKCEPAIKQMHRPIVESETATSALIYNGNGTAKTQIGPTLTSESFEYLNYSAESERPADHKGKVSSYNANTYKGRVYIAKHNRPVPFILADNARTENNVAKITDSLSENAKTKFQGGGEIGFNAFSVTSKNGRLKSIIILQVS